jgi:hypothetical protein
MRFRTTWLVLALVALWAFRAPAQQPTTVQLPTFSFFNTNTTVTVPDRGSVYLGGVNRAATGRNEFGAPLLPFRNRSIGMERSASSAWVSVWVHDFEAMDQYLLSQPTAFRAAQAANSRPLVPRVASRQPPVASSPGAPDTWNRRPNAAQQGPAGPTAMSLAELRAKHQREEQSRSDEAQKWFERGQGAEAAGKPKVARVYYQMAARRATGPLKAQIAARLDAVDGSSKPSKLAQSQPPLYP